MPNPLILMFPLLAPVAALATTPAPAPEIHTHVPNAALVGEGRLSVLVWDVYDAQLYAPAGEYASKPPFALSLSYLMDLSGEDIAVRSVEEMREQGMRDEVKLAAWYAQMKDIFPDVAPGVNLTGILNDKGESVFYRDGEEIGRIRDPEFGTRFFDIWLAESTSEPELRGQLLGAR